MLSIEFYFGSMVFMLKGYVCGIADKDSTKSAKPLWALSFHCRTRFQRRIYCIVDQTSCHIACSLNLFLAGG